MASQDIGDLGPGQTEPIQVTCDPLANVPRVVPWIIVAVLFIWQACRHRHTWAVLVPLVLIYLLWSLAKQLLPFESVPMGLLAQGTGDFAAALAVLWLTMAALTRPSRWKTLLLSLLAMIPVTVLASLAEASGTDSELTISRILCVTVASLAACSSLMLAAACSRRAILSRRFIAWLLLWLLLITVSGVHVVAATIMLIEGRPLRYFLDDFEEILFAGLVISAAVCLVFLPFVFLTSQSLSFRRRLETYLGAPLQPETASHEVSP